MLTSRHQTINERRASAASRRAFLKFRRASRQNRKRGDCHSLVANVERDSFIGHFDSAASIFVWSQTSSSWLPCQSPELDHTSPLTQATRVLLPRRIQSVRLYTYIPRDESTRRSRRLRETLQVIESLHDHPEKVARLRKLRHSELARRSSPSGVRLDYSPQACAHHNLPTSPTDATSCTSIRLSRVPKAPPSLRPLRDATRRTREQCVRARGCARADTLVSIRGGRVRVCICNMYMCACTCVYVCVRVCNAPLRALHRRKHPR